MKRPAPLILKPADWAGFALKEALIESLPELSEVQKRAFPQKRECLV